MLTIRTRQVGRDCEGTSRRNFLQVGSLALGGLTLPQLLRARAMGAATASGYGAAPRVDKDKSVVLLWLSGGPTHVETFNPVPQAPVEYRSITGAVDTVVPGMQLGGSFQRLAKVADRLSVVRSFAHGNSSHGGATHYVMTGYDGRNIQKGMAQLKPAYGSILAKYRGPSSARTGMPTYVRLRSTNYDGPGFLGKAFDAFGTGGETRKNMNLMLDADRVADRRSLLNSLDRLNRDADATGLMDGFDAYEQQAYGLILGQAKQAFDVNAEDRDTRRMYDNELGQELLLARRLCEAGCGFVTVNYGSWDMHGNIESSMRRRGPEVDRAVSAFIQDCTNRGLSDKILLVIAGEFGRTPRINARAGRDHWGPLCTLALSGGGLKMGQIVGESTAKAEVPKSTPIRPQDLMATLFHVLGVPQNLHFHDNGGRPVPMVDGGKPIAELI
jgi:hypothetical protein